MIKSAANSNSKLEFLLTEWSRSYIVLALAKSAVYLEKGIDAYNFQIISTMEYSAKSRNFSRGLRINPIFYCGMKMS